VNVKAIIDRLLSSDKPAKTSDYPVPTLDYRQCLERICNIAKEIDSRLTITSHQGRVNRKKGETMVVHVFCGAAELGICLATFELCTRLSEINTVMVGRATYTDNEIRGAIDAGLQLYDN